MKLVFKYTAYANKLTQRRFNESAGLCCDLYNLALEQRIAAFKSVCSRSVSKYDQQNELPEFKKANPEFSGVYSQTLQNVLIRLDNAFQSFFKRCQAHEAPGFPRFKSKDRYTTIVYNTSGYTIRGKYITFSKLGTFKLKLSRPILGDIKCVTLTKKSNGKFQVAFSCDNVPTKILPITGKAIGLDLGCTDIVSDSAGIKTENPKFLKVSQEKLRKLQANYASKKTAKARKCLAKLHEKVANQRKDFLHKLSRKYINENDLICVEKLQPQKLADKSYKNIRKSMIEASWAMLLQQLRYKAEYAGRDIVEVNPRNTSKMCSDCGELVEKTLSNRIHKCKCGLSIDSDVNAAKNILRAGQAPIRKDKILSLKA